MEKAMQKMMIDIQRMLPNIVKHEVAKGLDEAAPSPVRDI